MKVRTRISIPAGQEHKQAADLFSENFTQNDVSFKEWQQAFSQFKICKKGLFVPLSALLKQVSQGVKFNLINHSSDIYNIIVFPSLHMGGLPCKQFRCKMWSKIWSAYCQDLSALQLDCTSLTSIKYDEEEQSAVALTGEKRSGPCWQGRPRRPSWLSRLSMESRRRVPNQLWLNSDSDWGLFWCQRRYYSSGRLSIKFRI